MKGTLNFVLAGCVGRLPISMRALACFLLISESGGSYTVAGFIASVATFCQAAASPALGRLADRKRQGPLTLTAMAVHAGSIVGLIFLVMTGAPTWALIAAAAVFGASALPLGSLVRARWAALTEDRQKLQTAYALEAFVDDFVYMAGPAIVTTLVAAFFPSAGLLAVLGFVLVGWTALALQRNTEPRPLRPSEASEQRAAITEPGLRVLLLAYTAFGAWLGSIHVSMVAFAQEVEAPSMGGVLISLMVFGSMIAGLTYGAIQWRSSAVRRLSATAAILSAGSLPLVLVESLWLMSVLAVTAGIAITPMLISGYSLLGNFVPKGATTEAFSWIASSVAVGTGVGTAAAGALADSGGSKQAYLFVTGCALTALLACVTGRKWLARAPYAVSLSVAPGEEGTAA